MKKLLVILPLLLVSCNAENTNTPLGWCIKDISQTKFQYTYEELESNYEININWYKDATAKYYIITTYVLYSVPANRLTETKYYCEIIYNKKVNENRLKAKDIYQINKEICYEVNYY